MVTSSPNEANWYLKLLRSSSIAWRSNYLRSSSNITLLTVESARRVVVLQQRSVAGVRSLRCLRLPSRNWNCRACNRRNAAPFFSPAAPPNRSVVDIGIVQTRWLFTRNHCLPGLGHTSAILTLHPARQDLLQLQISQSILQLCPSSLCSRRLEPRPRTPR